MSTTPITPAIVFDEHSADEEGDDTERALIGHSSLIVQMDKLLEAISGAARSKGDDERHVERLSLAEGRRAIAELRRLARSAHGNDLLEM